MIIFSLFYWQSCKGMISIQCFWIESTFLVSILTVLIDFINYLVESFISFNLSEIFELFF